MYSRLKAWIEANTPLKLLNPRWYQTPICRQHLISDLKDAIYCHTPTRQNITQHTLCTQRISALVFKDGKINLMFNFVTPKTKNTMESRVQSIELGQDTVSLSRLIDDLTSLRDTLLKDGYPVDKDNSTYYGDPHGEKQVSLTNKLGYAIIQGASTGYYCSSAVTIINNTDEDETKIYKALEDAGQRFNSAGF